MTGTDQRELKQEFDMSEDTRIRVLVVTTTPW